MEVQVLSAALQQQKGETMSEKEVKAEEITAEAPVEEAKPELTKAEKKAVAKVEATRPLGGPLPTLNEAEEDNLSVHFVSPGGGPAGTEIRISGTGFEKVKSVKVGGVKADFSIESDSVIVATVGEGAENGYPVEVKAGKNTEVGRFTIATSVIW